MSKPALGRGLGALLGGSKAGGHEPSRPPVAHSPAPGTERPATSNVTSESSPPNTQPASQPGVIPSQASDGSSVRLVPIGQIVPSPLQPRKQFDEGALNDLAGSILANGVLQPLLVRPMGEHWELIAGERRWRASQKAGLTQVPVLTRSASDAEVLEMALIENLQRENLDPMEEAEGYQQLQSRFQLTQEQIATRVGRGRPAVANALRLLKLPPTVQDALRSGNISVGHAKVLLSLADPHLQALGARKIHTEAMSVRQAEAWVARVQEASSKSANPSTPPVPPTADPHVMDLESKLRERFTTKVKLSYRRGKGSMEIRFHSDDELNRILSLVGISLD